MTGNDWLWTTWFLAVLVSGTILEWYALKHEGRLSSLSRYMRNIGSKFPLSIFLIGAAVGGLAVHFWWPWCWAPPGAIGGIGLG